MVCFDSGLGLARADAIRLAIRAVAAATFLATATRVYFAPDEMWPSAWVKVVCGSEGINCIGFFSIATYS